MLAEDLCINLIWRLGYWEFGGGEKNMVSYWVYGSMWSMVSMGYIPIKKKKW